MKPIQLDFRRPPSASRGAGWLLLAVAAAFAADLGWSFHAERARLAENKAALKQTARRAAPAQPLPAATPEEVALARDTVERIGMPWERLFGAIEAAASQDVAVLAIEPDPKSGTVVISADGKDYLAALTYVLNLSRVEGLSEVHLVRHEVKAEDPQQPIAFAVSAAWGGRS